MSNAESPAVTPLTPAEVDALAVELLVIRSRRAELESMGLSGMIEMVESLHATVRDRERQRDIAWRSSEDWERQSKLYEKERDELQRQLEQEANDHNSIQVQTEHERNAFQAKSGELQRQLDEQIERKMKAIMEQLPWYCELERLLTEARKDIAHILHGGTAGCDECRRIEIRHREAIDAAHE